MVDKIINEIERLVHTESLLSFAGYKRQHLLRKSEERAQDLGFDSICAYSDHLRLTPSELQNLLPMLTVHETSFFRNQRQFNALKELVSPRIVKDRGDDLVRHFQTMASGSRPPGYKLRVLCAGCSTGEEPYSVALALLESLQFSSAWEISIVAGDISEKCLKIARKGWYGEDRLKNVPLSMRRRYMDHVDNGWQFKQRVRQMIRFKRLNLRDFVSDRGYALSESDGAMFDIIFCRNVMIYFPFEVQQKLVDSLHDALVPGGYLFTGDAEPLHIFEHAFNSLPEADCLIYQKSR
jgi:chemotaxis protein methyltransferase CheR